MLKFNKLFPRRSQASDTRQVNGTSLPVSDHHLETVGMVETPDGLLPAFDKKTVLDYLIKLYGDEEKANKTYQAAWLSNRDIVLIQFHASKASLMSQDDLLQQEYDKIEELKNKLMGDE